MNRRQALVAHREHEMLFLGGQSPEISLIDDASFMQDQDAVPAVFLREAPIFQALWHTLHNTFRITDYMSDDYAFRVGKDLDDGRSDRLDAPWPVFTPQRPGRFESAKRHGQKGSQLQSLQHRNPGIPGSPKRHKKARKCNVQKKTSRRRATHLVMETADSHADLLPGATNGAAMAPRHHSGGRIY
jgi:hypothetical protein